MPGRTFILQGLKIEAAVLLSFGVEMRLKVMATMKGYAEFLHRKGVI